tara:strand:+ start:282 stop:410 length:129 start_codon:yes stop_codon:yes gene_type:complete
MYIVKKDIIGNKTKKYIPVLFKDVYLKDISEITIIKKIKKNK